jgi:parallel beta-helix repeat protein
VRRVPWSSVLIAAMLFATVAAILFATVVILYRPPLQETRNYIVLAGNTNQIIALNGATGHIDFSGTDARTVIQSAIDALKQGGTIHLKEGMYSLSRNPAWTNAAIVFSGVTNLTFEGEGNRTILRVAEGANVDAILIQGSTNAIVIRNMEIDGNKAQQTSEHHGVEIDGGTADAVSDVLIERLYVHDTYGTGIWIQRSSNIRIYNNLVTSNRGMDKNSQGIKVYNATHVVIKDNTVRNGNWRCIGITQGSYDVEVEDNTIDSCESAMEISGSDMGPSYQIEVIGNHFRNVKDSGDAIRIEDDSYDVTITSNTIEYVQRYAIFVLSGHNLTIDANTMRYIGDYAIYVSHGYNIAIESNTITNVGGTVYLP